MRQLSMNGLTGLFSSLKSCRPFPRAHRTVATAALAVLGAAISIQPADAQTRSARAQVAITNDIVRPEQACEPKRALRFLGRPIRLPVVNEEILVKSPIGAHFYRYRAHDTETDTTRTYVLAIYYYTLLPDERLKKLSGALMEFIGNRTGEVSDVRIKLCPPFYTRPAERVSIAFGRIVDIDIDSRGRLGEPVFRLAATLSVLSESTGGGEVAGSGDGGKPIRPTGPCPFKEAKLCKLAGYADTGGSGKTKVAGAGETGSGPPGSAASRSDGGPPTDGGSGSARGDVATGKGPADTGSSGETGPGFSGDTTARLDGSDGDRVPGSEGSDSAGPGGTGGADGMRHARRPGPSGGVEGDGSGGSSGGGATGTGDGIEGDSGGASTGVIEVPDDTDEGESGDKIAKRKRYPKPNYPLLPAKRKLPSIGRGVFVVEKVECGEAGNWMTGYHGILKSYAEDKSPVVRLRDRYGVNNYPGVSGDDPVSTSVDKKRWWCIPRKEFCYQKVEFGDWGGKYKPGDVMTARPETTYGYNHKLIAILQDAVTRACGKPGKSVAKE